MELQIVNNRTIELFPKQMVERDTQEASTEMLICFKNWW